MIRLSDEQKYEFRNAVELAALRSDLADPLSAIYQSVTDAVDLHRPVCVASGACCRFDGYGHLLFVTTIELAEFVRQLPVSERSSDKLCPFQIGNRCGVHTIRPLGCRIFYCDPAAELWQKSLYEGLQRNLRRLHEEKDVPYMYVEWRQALRALGLSEGSTTSGVATQQIL